MSRPTAAGVRKRLRENVDWMKWIAMTGIGLAAIGWYGREYIQQFETKKDAQVAQHSNQEAHAKLQSALENQRDRLRDMRIIQVRVELEQRTTNDRLEQVLELQRALTHRERLAAEAEVAEIQHRIDRRARIIRNSDALVQAVDRVDGFDGL